VATHTHTHTHNLLYFNGCGREVPNYGVEIKEDITSTEHTASMEEICTQIRSKKQKGRLSDRSWIRQRIILKKRDRRCGVDSSGSVQGTQSKGIKIIR